MLDNRYKAAQSVSGLQALVIRRARVKQLIVELPPLVSILTDPIVVRMSHLDVALAQCSEDEYRERAATPAKTQTPRQTPSKRSYGLAEKLVDGALIAVDILSLSFHTMDLPQVRKRYVRIIFQWQLQLTARCQLY